MIASRSLSGMRSANLLSESKDVSADGVVAHTVVVQGKKTGNLFVLDAVSGARSSRSRSVQFREASSRTPPDVVLYMQGGLEIVPKG